MARDDLADALRVGIPDMHLAVPEGDADRVEIDVAGGELTRTRKVRRGVVFEKYGDIIEAVYGDRDAVDVNTTIAFQDGTTQRIRTNLTIVDLAGQGGTGAGAA